MYNAAVYMPVTTRGSSMAARYEFTRLFRELTEPLTKAQVAKRIKVTPSYVSQLRAGTYGPSRDLIERIIEAFDLDRATWLRAAGFRAPGDLHPDPEDVLIERLAPKVAAKLAYDPNRFERELLEALAEHYGIAAKRKGLNCRRRFSLSPASNDSACPPTVSGCDRRTGETEPRNGSVCNSTMTTAILPGSPITTLTILFSLPASSGQTEPLTFGRLKANTPSPSAKSHARSSGATENSE
jgi:transcriptional regulator with XRE-family HTH domain